MAVIKSLGLSASIVINGEAVPKYDDPDPELNHEHSRTKTVSKYIEFEDDLIYSIRCEALPSHRWLPNRKGNLLEFGITIDGDFQYTYCLGFDRWDNGVSMDILGVPAHTSHECGTLRKFQFGSINARKNNLEAAALAYFLRKMSLIQNFAVGEADPRTVQKDLKRVDKLGIIHIEVLRSIEIGEGTEVPQTTAEEGLKLNC